MIRLLLLAALGLVVLVVGAAIAIPFFIPASVYEDRIERAATDALGREVTIDGSPKLKIFPTEIAVTGLTVANAEGFAEPYLLRVGEAAIGVELLPLLLSRTIEITRFDLDGPDIRLEQSAEGGNWELGQPPADGEDTEGGEDAPLPDLRLGTVNVNDGTIRFTTQTGEIWRAEDANLKLELPDLASALLLNGTLRVQDTPARVAVRFEDIAGFVEFGRAALDLDMTVGENRIDTELQLGENLSYEGRLDVDFPALRAILALLGTPVDADAGFEKLRLTGPVSGDAENFTFGEGTTLAFDGIEGSGAFSIALGGERPRLSGDLDLGTLDLTPYLPAVADDSLANAAPAPEARANVPPWSTEPMDFSALRTADMNLTLRSDEVVLPQFSIGPTLLGVLAQNGDVRVDVQRTELFGGQGRGTVRADASGPRPRFVFDMSLTDVEAGTAAEQLAGITRLGGRGTIRLSDLTATGNTQAELVRTLNGGVTLELADGQIEGVNLGRLARAAYGTYDRLSTGNALEAPKLMAAATDLVTAARGPASATDFTGLTVDLDAQNGTVTAQTLRLNGPYFEITGEARTELPAQTISMRLTPAVMPEGGGALRPLPVPIVVGGTFNDPALSVDFRPAAEGAARNQLGRLLEQQGVTLSDGATLEEQLRNTGANELRRTLDRQTGGGGEGGQPVQGGSLQDELMRQGAGALGNFLGGNRARPAPAEQQPAPETAEGNAPAN